jgi:hypothetical protein
MPMSSAVWWTPESDNSTGRAEGLRRLAGEIHVPMDAKPPMSVPVFRIYVRFGSLTYCTTLTVTVSTLLRSTAFLQLALLQRGSQMPGPMGIAYQHQPSEVWRWRLQVCMHLDHVSLLQVHQATTGASGGQEQFSDK